MLLKLALVFLVMWTSVLLLNGRTFLQGFLTGVYVTGYVALVGHLFTVRGLTARGMGADAEEWTAQLMDRLGRGWSALHGIVFDGRDVDHVLVGPAHVFALETKWRTDALDVIRPDPGHLRQARWGAERIGKLLSSQKAAEIEPIPVLVYWGPHLTGPRTGVVDGVLVLRSPDVRCLREELFQLTENRAGLVEWQRAQLLEELTGFASRQETYFAKRSTAAERRRRVRAEKAWSWTSRARQWRSRNA